jgi:hypothetical protein
MLSAPLICADFTDGFYQVYASLLMVRYLCFFTVSAWCSFPRQQHASKNAASSSVASFSNPNPNPAMNISGWSKQGSADSRISESLRLSLAACSQKVDVYRVKNRRL